MQVIVTSRNFCAEELALGGCLDVEALPVAVVKNHQELIERVPPGTTAVVIGQGASTDLIAESRAFRVQAARDPAQFRPRFVPTGEAGFDDAASPADLSAGLANSPRARMEREIDLAITRNEFELLFQPQISLENFQVSGAEVLIRWRHPSHGVIPPGEFLPVAETSGQICAIGNWVLNTVCANYAKWRAWLEPGATFAVNVSAVEFQDSRFLGNFLAILGAHQVPGCAIELEVTETALLSNPASARRSIECFRRNGLRVALDDFGVGYSCLASLRDFPFTKIKIDQSFVQHLHTSNRNRTIVRSMIELGHSIRLAANAVGVENEEQLRILYDYGCHEVQGHLLASPMPIQRFAAWVRGYQGEHVVPGIGQDLRAEGESRVIAFHRPRSGPD